MKRLIDYIRGSFSARLSIWVVLFVALIFLASQTYVSAVGRRSLREEAVRTADQVLDNTNLRLETIIEDVESAADNLEWLVYRHLDSPETLLEYSRTTVQGNPFLSGCSISLEPYFFKGMKYFSAYSSNTDGVVETNQEGDEDYEYFYLDWYLMPKLLNQPCWTEPYCDWEYGDDYSLQTEMLISYSKPLTANDGTFIGVISLDISLKWLSETLSDIKPYPNSYSILISRGGTFLVHPDPEKLFYQTIFTNLLIKDDPTFDRIGRKVINGGEGMEEVKLNGTDSFMFFKPVKSTGWSLAIVCPQRDIFGSFNRLRWIFDLILLLSLFLLFLTCFNVIRRTVKPLSDLSAEAESIAEGDFNRPLPLVERIDEIGTLSRSFSHMQSSLVSYIDELKETTAKKERIEGELRIAHDIQMGMVPNVFPAFPEEEDLDLYASMTPAKEVGGDLYDYFLRDGQLYFCIGDVSGKGIPASLFMATTRNLFRALGKHASSPAGIASRLNDTISEENEAIMFVTAFIGVLDLRTGRLEYCNCGHNPPVFIHTGEGEPVFLDCLPNTPIGVMNGWNYQGQEIADFRGCTLFLYTDGLNEAANSGFEEFGEDRILSVLRGKAARAGAETIVSSMQRAVAAHVGDAEHSDDLTMLCIKLKAKDENN